MTSDSEGPSQPRPWPGTSLEAARQAQEHHAWSDEELLRRLLLVLRRSPLDEVAAERRRTEDELDALGPASTDLTERIDLVAGRLPTYGGYFASQILSDALATADRLPPLPPAPAEPAPPTGHDRPLRPRQVLLPMGTTIVAMALLAVVLVLLGV